MNILKYKVYSFLFFVFFILLTIFLVNNFKETVIADTSVMSDTVIKYPSNIFTGSETIKFTYSVKNRDLNWRVLDWKQTVAASGTHNFSSGNLNVPVIQPGYYLMEVKEPADSHWGKGVVFAVVVDPDARVHNPDNPFCLDSGQSIFPFSNGLMSDLALYSGSTMIRDRLSWTSSVSNWAKNNETGRLSMDRNIELINVLYNAPVAVRGPLMDLPHNLNTLYDHTKKVASNFADSTPAWEFWNEQDILEFNRDSAWDFAAAQKVGYLGFKAGNPSGDVLVGATTQNLELRFNEVVYANEIKEYYDIFNFHSYTGSSGYTDVVKGKLDMLARWDAKGKPIWVTEFGTFTQGTGNSVVPGKAEHNRLEELYQAEELVKSAITLHTLGVQKSFFFILPAWNSHRNDVHGLMRFDTTIKPGFTAHSNLTHQLGSAVYLGKVSLPNGVIGYLYEQPDKTRTLVFWNTGTLSLTNQTRTNLRLVDMLGKTTIVNPSNKNVTLPSDKYPQYLHGVTGLTYQNTVLDNSPSAKITDKLDQSIVLRMTSFKNVKIINRVAIEFADSNQTSAVLDVFNFSNKQKVVSLNDISTNCLIGELPASVTVPALGKVSVNVTLSISNSELADISISGSTSEGRVSSIYIPITPRFSNNTNLDKKILENTAQRWEKNTNGKMVIEDDPSQSAVKFTVTDLPTNGGWIYPRYRIDHTSNSMENAIGIVFDIKVENKERAFIHSFSMINLKTSQNFRIPYPQPTTEWQTVKLYFRENQPSFFVSEMARNFSIGFNPDQTNITYWIRDMEIIYDANQATSPTPKPTQQPTPSPTAQPTQRPTPTPTPTPTPSPTTQPTPLPTTPADVSPSVTETDMPSDTAADSEDPTSDSPQDNPNQSGTVSDPSSDVASSGEDSFTDSQNVESGFKTIIFVVLIVLIAAIATVLITKFIKNRKS